MSDSFSAALTERALNTIQTELKFLLELKVITPQQFESINNNLPSSANASAVRAPLPTPTPEPPVQQMNNLSVARNEPQSEKKGGYYALENNNSSPNPPPPAYPSAPAAPVGPPALAYATALYQFNAQDAGDLAILPNDKIVVTEFMNNEWWKGRNERSGLEGIFPAGYVRREENRMVPPTPMAPQPSNYGNVPLDVSNGAASNNHEPSKGEDMGKKFGKKLGNAAIFGAGATIGGKIVNGIF
ncbi:SH3 domain-containing protein [Dendryphion nanum]|uniref:SH3 domain-containing protein n=1 Tax=Dendryphion nanum TaxID=256645 RepID=A0A9P9EDB0_9PLEO|nr:SH3 domain-containing protein [Dendryphion nanum]